LINKGIFGYKKSPYLQLLKLSNCAYKDVEKMVLKYGIEETLMILREEGVYFTVGEFKGEKRVVRKGKEFVFKKRDFDNPYTASCYESYSSGSRSSGTRVIADFDYKHIWLGLLQYQALFYAPVQNLLYLKYRLNKQKTGLLLR